MSLSSPMEDKENLAPQLSSNSLARGSSSFSPIKPTASRKGRSKSIGPGGLDDITDSVRKDSRQEAKNRRKSTYVPATKAIISADAEKNARQAARRKTLANRRVSFAPEATLHTWDVVEFMRDQTTSTDSSGHTRRGSGVSHSNETSSDGEDEDLLSSPANTLPATKKRRSSGIPPMNFNNPDDAASSSGMSSGSEASESEDEKDDDDDDEADGSEDATGTAMSLDMDDGTLVSHLSDGTSSSTGSSARLEASLRLAAEQAGTRGIDYDEHGDGDFDEEVSMELADDAITNAFQPWAAQAGLQPSFAAAAMDQENINPFSPAFKADTMSTIDEEETGDMSMEVTRAVGNILKTRSEKEEHGSSSDATMDAIQTIGFVHDTNEDPAQATRDFHKRRRTTSEAGSPGAVAGESQSNKRRRSSAARSSMGDDTMDLTMAVGSIQNTAAAPKVSRRRSMRRRSSGMASEQADVTMDFTQAVGSIKDPVRTEHTGSSFDENEELTMELTTVLGGIREAQTAPSETRPTTPEVSQSPVVEAVNTTPKDQERFTNVPDSGPRKLLTPLLQQQTVALDVEAASSPFRKSASPTKRRSRRISQAAAEMKATDQASTIAGEEERDQNLSGPASPINQHHSQSPVRTPILGTSNGELQVQLDAQFQDPDHELEASPIAAKQQRSSPAKPTVVPPTSPKRTVRNSVSIDPIKLPLSSPIRASASRTSTPDPKPVTPHKLAITPERVDVTRTLAESIRLMNTPYKESLKVGTPRKQTQLSAPSPQRPDVFDARPSPRSAKAGVMAPTAQVTDDSAETPPEEAPIDKIPLQTFLEMAQIRFMDLTTTKRRMTVAATPSKMQKFRDAGVNAATSLDGAVVASACITPELEMYRHACHELKHYISDGKKVIKQLDNETYRKTPPLLRAYVQACQNSSSDDQRHALDAQMRDMKTHARLRSKELWYAWRTQLLEDLVKALSGIAEGLIRDDEILRDLEEIVGESLPGLTDTQQTLSLEAHHLEQAAMEIPVEDKMDLQDARRKILDVDGEVERKQKLLDDLRNQDLERRQFISDMLESKLEFDGAIEEAERVREACRGVSLQEIASLKDSIMSMEETYGWSIISAESSPQTVTMTYKSQLQLYFHPSSFNVATQRSDQPLPNAPIRLNYIAQAGKQESKDLTTTLRFFHQLLRASLQALPQYATRIPDLLNLISGGWDTALSVAEAERRLNLETLTTSRIISDERLAIESLILLPAVKTKVLVAFELFASIGGAGPGDDSLALNLTIQPSAQIVYGESYNEGKMTKNVIDRIDGVYGWDVAVKDLKGQLIVHGAKKSAQR